MGLYHFELCKRNSPTGQYEWPTDLTSHLYAHSGPLPTGVVYWSAAQLVSQQMVGSPTGQSANGRLSNWSVSKWSALQLVSRQMASRQLVSQQMAFLCYK